MANVVMTITISFNAIIINIGGMSISVSDFLVKMFRLIKLESRFGLTLSSNIRSNSN